MWQGSLHQARGRRRAHGAVAGALGGQPRGAILHLVTRRAQIGCSASLGVPGEIAYRVPPLACPERHSTLDRREALRYDAVRLFAERAELARSSVRLTSEELGAVVEVCIQLDGIPLAIELAAARLAMLSVDEVAARLEDRFSLLRGGSRTALPRHRTLEATIDWSYRLLAQREQRMFSRLAVFNGGFTLDAAEQVCVAGDIEPRDVVELVGSLIDQSLLVREEDAGGSRYRQLETIRAFAADRLAEDGSTDLVAERHAACYAGLAARAAEQLYGPEQEEWLRRLEADHGNLRTALRWLADRDDIEPATRLAVALRRFWLTRGHSREGLDQLSALLHRGTGLPDNVVAEALASAGLFAGRLGEYDRALAYHRRSLECYGRIDDPGGIGRASVDLGIIMSVQGVDLDEVERLAEQAATTAESVGDDETLTRCAQPPVQRRHRPGRLRSCPPAAAPGAWRVSTHGRQSRDMPHHPSSGRQRSPSGRTRRGRARPGLGPPGGAFARRPLGAERCTREPGLARLAARRSRALRRASPPSAGSGRGGGRSVQCLVDPRQVLRSGDRDQNDASSGGDAGGGTGPRPQDAAALPGRSAR